MMTALPKLALTVFVLLLIPACTARGQVSQQRSSQPWSGSARTLIAVKVSGTKRYSQEEVVSATRLQMGVPASEDDFKKASRVLGATGAFTDIAYSYLYSPAGTKLEFTLADAEKFLPARFEDFVWFSDDELRRRIKEHVPLFNGELPISGRLPDEVSDVLQALLVENGIPGHVNYARAEGPDGRTVAFSYSVADVLIRVRNVEFTGAAATELPALESAAQKLPDREYSRSAFNTFVERQLLPVYHARGYLKASFGPPQPKVVKPSADEAADEPKNQTDINVALVAAPGRQYRLSRLEWAGNKEISTDTLQSMVRLAPGQLADTVQLADNLAAIKKLYGSRGYINVSIKTEADFDDGAGTVAIRLEVKEDYLYRMGELEFRGIDNSLTAKLRAAWKLRQGDVYDATYLNQYLPQANRLLPSSLDWGVEVHVAANVRDKTVDVDLQYTAKAPR
jgi:outer membrane protein assembly factor BamA